MPFFFYLVIFIIVTVLISAVVIFILYKRNNHPKLYNEGLKRENEGHYNLALDSYEEALHEINKRKVNSSLGRRISQKIKILQTTINYEKNFQHDSGA